MSRTGVFIAAMCEVERVKVEGEVDFFQTIKAMRKKRPHMVYNKVRPSHSPTHTVQRLLAHVYVSLKSINISLYYRHHILNAALLCCISPLTFEYVQSLVLFYSHHILHVVKLGFPMIPTSCTYV